VSIGTNIVQLNTANPSVRFAGLTIIDSGSVGGSGSFLYDSVHDEFVFVHRGNGTNITSSHFVLGPETYDSLGNETYLTCNVLTKGTGKEHLIDSCIFDNGTTTCIKNNLIGTGTITLNNASANYATLNLNGAAGYGAELKFGEVTGGYLAAIRHNYNVGTGLEFYTCGLGIGSLRMYIAPTGNIGIGTTSPDRKLDIACANASDTKLVIRTACGFAGSYSPSLDFHIGGYESTCTTGQIKMCGTNNYSGDMIFSTQLSGTINPLVERMRISCGGNVGIGTTTPSATLHLCSITSGTPIMRIQNSSGTGYSSITFHNSSNTSSGHVGYGNSGVASPLTSAAFFGTITANDVVITSTDCERIRIASNGITTFACQVCVTKNLIITGEGMFINRPASSSGEPYLFFQKDGVNRGSIYGADGTAGLRYFSDVNIFYGNVVPDGNNTRNLGSTTCGWANIYTNDFHLSNMNKCGGNDIDGTNGNWTIQEGICDIYIINNNTCEKYKFNLTKI